MEREAKKGMGEDERSFVNEMSLEQKTYLWSDKYRPRKPRYFNRVHTVSEQNVTCTIQRKQYTKRRTEKVLS